MNYALLTQLEEAINSTLEKQEKAITFLLKKQKQLFYINATLSVFLFINFILTLISLLPS